MTALLPMAAAIAAPIPAVRPAPLDRLPGTPGGDPFLRLAAGWLVGHPARTATAYRRDLEAWARWCTHLGIYPLAAERYHVDAWVRHLTTEPQPRTDRPAATASVAQVVTHSPSHRAPAQGLRRVPGRRADRRRAPPAARRGDGALCPLSRAGVGADLLRVAHLRGEALGADVRDYGHDHGHRVLKADFHSW